jgi:hypothetical protein
VVLPVLLSEPGVPVPPPSAAPRLWLFDSGTRGEAFAWRQHLLDAGLDPTFDLYPRPVIISSSAGGKQAMPIRRALLWLVSNLPTLQNSPYRLELLPGLPFRDVPQLPDPQFHRPLIGLRPLLRAGLKIELNFAQKTVSVWVPDTVGDAKAPGP